jgi:hypothetical protein
MSIQDKINSIPQQKLASDMPDTFSATVINMVQDVKKGQFAGAPLLKLELELDNGEKFTTSYRIPKAWTGKGQMDKLMSNLKSMNIEIKDLIGKTFAWKREGLGGSVKGNERHYPIKLLKPQKKQGL